MRILQGNDLTLDPMQVQEIRRYIKQSWTTLRRSNLALLQSATDTKVGQAGRLTLYVPHDEDLPHVTAQLQQQLTPEQWAQVTLCQLPEAPETINKAGLLYLPQPYIVPGGRFNEMYGWDSYFTLLGLVRDGEVALAKAMTENFLYEVMHYGKILNANRTYYLTRSHPPFLTQMVLEVFRYTGDLAWLAATLPAIEQYYHYWLREPHLTPATGLSRYHGGASTPAQEVVHGECDAAGKNHYDRARAYYRTHPVAEYDVTRYYDQASDQLTPLFYIGDRAMRESGFDPSARFGPFSVDIIHYNPVDLNTLLYRMETDTAAILTVLDQPQQAQPWTERAQWRAKAINQLMWDEAAGLYFDYNFEKQQRASYPFVTTFFPLWAGIATSDQATKVLANLSRFEQKGGLQTSTHISGNQWDAPFGWAPLQVIAVEGLRRYGFHDAADRISHKFLAMVLQDFAEHGVIKEKYDVVTAKSDLAVGLKFGYTSNEVGFGWTNAAFVLLSEQLAQKRESVYTHNSG